MLRLFRRRERERDALLSAYLDDQLSERERERLEARLASDPELQAELEALRRTVSSVRELPPVPAPRNFILSPSMVKQPTGTSREPTRRPEPRAKAWAAPLLTAATAVVALLFVVVLMGDLFLPGLGGMASAPEMLTQEEPPQVALEAMPTEKVEVEAERAVAEPTTPPPTAEAMLEEPEEPVSKEEESYDAQEGTVVAEALPGAEGTPPPPGMGGGGPITQAAALAATPALTVTEETGAMSTIPVEVTPTPEMTPSFAREEGEGERVRGERTRLPWRALEIALGVAALGLGLATIAAWRARRR